MRPFWKLAGVTVAFAALLYGLAVVAALAVSPAPTFDTDVTTRQQPLWGNPARYAVFHQSHFARDTDRVVILGASNAREGLRPAIIDDALPGWTVDDLGLSGATLNVSELEDARQLVRDVQTDARTGRTIYVLGLTYTVFADDVPGTDNSVEQEMLRYQYARTDDGALTPRLPLAASPAISALARPLEFIRALPRVTAREVLTPELKARAKALIGQAPGPGEPVDFGAFIAAQPDLDAVVLTDAMRADLLRERLGAAQGDRPLSDQQFRRLDALIARILADGDAVVIADLPVPGWHLAGLPNRQASYRAQLAAVLARHAGDARVGYLDLSGLNAADDFYDSIHAKPRHRVTLSRRLGAYLQAFAAEGVPARD